MILRHGLSVQLTTSELLLPAPTSHLNNLPPPPALTQIANGYDRHATTSNREVEATTRYWTDGSEEERLSRSATDPSNCSSPSVKVILQLRQQSSLFSYDVP